MGKGDKRSKKGKITISSYGVSRPRKTKKANIAKPVVKAAKAEPKVKKEKAEPKAAKPAAAKKTSKKKTEE
jgi:30S ribosomal protein S31